MLTGSRSDDSLPQAQSETNSLEEPPLKKNPSYQRNYRACYLCRQKKIRCDLGDLSNPQPPCAKCRREKKKCVFGPGGRGKRDLVHVRGNGTDSADGIVEIGPNLSSLSAPHLGTTVSTGHDSANQDCSQSVPRVGMPASETLDHVTAIPHQTTEDSPNQFTVSHSTDACSQSIVETVIRGEDDALRLLFDATRPLESEHVSKPRDDLRLSVENGVLQQLPTLTPKQIACWHRFPSCLQRFVSPAEVVAYIDYFFAVLNNQLPILSSWFSDEVNHSALLAQDTMLCYTILTVSSRYLILPGHNGLSRGYLLHDHFFKYVQESVQGLLWGVSFGSQTGKSLVGAIESLVLLTQWQPRGLYVQTSSFELSKIAVASAGALDDASDPRDGTSHSILSSMALRSDTMCWRLANLATTLSFESGIFDEELAGSLSKNSCSGYSFRVPHLQQLLHIYVSHLAARLKRPNPLASVSSARIKQNAILTMRSSSSENSSAWCSALNMWIDLLELGNITMDMLYPMHGSSVNKASKERQDPMVRHLASATLRWWGEFEALKIPTIFRLSIEVEYHYLRILIHSVGLQSGTDRAPQHASWRPYAPSSRDDISETLLQEVKHSCCRVYEIIFEMQRLQALRSITAPFLLRLVTVSVFGLKVIASSEAENDNFTRLLSDAIAALRQSAVDDLHLAGYYAALLERVARKTRNRSSRSTAPLCRTRQPIETGGDDERGVNDLTTATFSRDTPMDYGTIDSDQWDDWLAFQFDPTLAVIGDCYLSNTFVP